MGVCGVRVFMCVSIPTCGYVRVREGAVREVREGARVYVFKRRVYVCVRGGIVCACVCEPCLYPLV